MKLLCSFPVITAVGVVTAVISRRGISTDGASFASKPFDYVVIGGGTAGLALAARLSEDPKTTVGVIEAGEYLPDDPLINTPAFAFSIPGNPKYDWMFKSVPQVNANNQGKVLGGSSAINVMAFDRGSHVEYDAWAELGNSGWDWDGLLPNMKAAERFTGVDPFRGKNGVVAADYNNWYSDVVPPFRKSMAKMGVPINFNPRQCCWSLNTATSINRTTGRRSYSTTTYYAYSAHRPNLVVLTGAQATKINFKDTTGSNKPSKLVASGVSFMYQSQTYTVKALKEVYSRPSPHLLELSGIGNSTILEKNGIKSLVDLPSVGENYQDHVLIATAYELKREVRARTTIYWQITQRMQLQLQRNMLNPVQQRNTRWYSVLTASTLSFLSLGHMASSTEIAKLTAEVDRELGSKDLAPLQSASYKIQKGWLKENVGFVELIPYPGYAGVGTPKANTSYITFFAVVQHPFSRGSIHINSSDPLTPPQIDPKYFSKSIDLDILVHSVKFVDKLSKTEPLASLIASRQEPSPKVISDAAIAEYIKANVESIHHPIGAVSIAPKQLGGAVGVNMKVYGTANVRVVDASVMPLHIGSHTQRTVYGIAEKAAKIIKQGL
ncbi:hypothetical protein B0J17DRAFT_718623 [Rhizoctonia solani]|nr:hypothetical protein B0J17DRAFT_718623 [Rhizoctonia solani]